MFWLSRRPDCYCPSSQRGERTAKQCKTCGFTKNLDILRNDLWEYCGRSSDFWQIHQPISRLTCNSWKVETCLQRWQPVKFRSNPPATFLDLGSKSTLKQRNQQWNLCISRMPNKSLFFYISGRWLYGGFLTMWVPSFNIQSSWGSPMTSEARPEQLERHGLPEKISVLLMNLFYSLAKVVIFFPWGNHIWDIVEHQKNSNDRSELWNPSRFPSPRGTLNPSPNRR